MLAVDDSGETLLTVEGGLGPGSESQVVSFQIDEEAYGVALWAYTTDDDVSVSYNMTVPASTGQDDSLAPGLASMPRRRTSIMRSIPRCSCARATVSLRQVNHS